MKYGDSAPPQWPIYRSKHNLRHGLISGTTYCGGLLHGYMTLYVFWPYSWPIYDYRVRKIIYEGCTYREADVVILGKDGDDAPVFGVVRNINHHYQEDKCFLEVTYMQAEYHSHYHAYHVVTSSHTDITTPQALHTPHAFNTHTCFAVHLSHLKFASLEFFCVIFVSYVYGDDQNSATESH